MQYRFILTICYCCYYFIIIDDTLMMAAVSSVTTSSTKKKSSTQAVHPPSSAKVNKASNVHSPQVKDTSINDDTICVEDDVLMCILVEAATAAEVEPEVEDQVGNGQPNNIPFCSINCSLFVLGKTVKRGEITVSCKQQPSLNFTFTPNRWAYFVAMLNDINTEVKELNRKMRLVSFRRH